MSERDTAGLTLGDLEEDPNESATKKAIRESVAAATPSPLEEGGYAGPAAGGNPIVDAVVEASNPYNFGRVVGASESKFNDPNKKDYKYDVLRTLSKHDPRGGFTPDVLKDLNSLGYGNFSSSGKDKLSLTGATNSPDAKDFKDLDYIYAFGDQSPSTKWQMGLEDTPGGVASPEMLNANPMLHGGSAINPGLLSGDFFRQLLERAKSASGPEATSQDALLSLMG